MSSLQGLHLLHLGHLRSQTDRTRRHARVRYRVGPLVDLAALHGSSEDRSLAVDNIGKACQEKGFFQVMNDISIPHLIFFRLLHILLIMELWLVQVINHGISPSVTGGALMAARKFFELPTEEKMELASDDITRPVRYGSSPQRSFLKQYSHPIEKWMDLWPSKPAEFRCANFLPKLQIR